MSLLTNGDLVGGLIYPNVKGLSSLLEQSSQENTCVAHLFHCGKQMNFYALCHEMYR
jgi:hypothetical protein